MSILSDNTPTKSVVIVGGGFAGVGLFNILEKSLDAKTINITLITPRSFFINLPAVLRMVVTADEAIEDRILLPYTERFNQGNKRLVLGTVTSIVEDGDHQGGHIVLDNGERVDYNILALATGSNWEGCLNFPESVEDVRKHDKHWRSKLEEAKNVVLIGGGGVGFGMFGFVLQSPLDLMPF